jgi:hypothetical protein
MARIHALAENQWARSDFLLNLTPAAIATSNKAPTVANLTSVSSSPPAL